MRDEYDFSKAERKNPYYEKMRNGYSVTVHYDFNERDDEKSNETKTADDMNHSNLAPSADTSV